MFHFKNPDQNLNKYTLLTLSRKDSNNSIVNNLSNRIVVDVKKHTQQGRVRSLICFLPSVSAITPNFIKLRQAVWMELAEPTSCKQRHIPSIEYVLAKLSDIRSYDKRISEKVFHYYAILHYVFLHYAKLHNF